MKAMRNVPLPDCGACVQMPISPGFDRWLNYIVPPAFLVAVQPKERDWWRIVLVFAFGALGLIVASIVAVLISAALGALVLMAFDGAAGFGAGFSAAFGILGAMAEAADDPSLVHEAVRLIMIGVTFAALAIAVLVVVATVNRRPMRSWITAAPRFRWKLALAGLGLYAGVLAVWFVIAWLTGDDSLQSPIFRADQPLDVRLLYVVVSLLAIPVAAAFEEILCRGWMLQLTGAFTRNLIPLLLVNGVIFSALHLDPDLGRNIARLASGVVFSYAVLRLGGLEFAIGAHAANNLMIGLFASTLTANLDVTVKSTPLEVLVELGISAVLVGLIELTARWTPLRRWTGADVEALQAR